MKKQFKIKILFSLCLGLSLLSPSVFAITNSPDDIDKQYEIGSEFMKLNEQLNKGNTLLEAHVESSLDFIRKQLSGIKTSSDAGILKNCILLSSKVLELSPSKSMYIGELFLQIYTTKQPLFFSAVQSLKVDQGLQEKEVENPENFGQAKSVIAAIKEYKRSRNNSTETREL